MPWLPYWLYQAIVPPVAISVVRISPTLGAAGHNRNPVPGRTGRGDCRATAVELIRSTQLFPQASTSSSSRVKARSRQKRGTVPRRGQCPASEVRGVDTGART
jgi:hypothetical protein